ncbi:MAG: hypothetical protein LV479_02505 [Methylacidiphilales bacterium]|nr:hypothetical protein [Candidatus Methylacidiphilales bacterium]
MKPTFVLLFAGALLALPIAAWADTYPDFDDDAKPILRMQPGLLHYVESHFDVKDTGRAKYPGDDDRSPVPPFIFEARPSGSSGPYNLRLLIQPGPVNHILNIVDINRVRFNGQAPQPAPAPAPAAPPPQQAVVNHLAPQNPAPAISSVGNSSASTEPTADTPSGPILGDGGKAAPLPPPPSSTPSLQPPPDPAPNSQ